MARQLAVRNREHANRFEYCDQAKLAFSADRGRVLDSLVVLGQRLDAVALQLRRDVAVDHQRLPDQPHAHKRMRLHASRADPGRASVVPANRCSIGDGGT
jgi:hypothetical protein